MFLLLLIGGFQYFMHLEGGEKKATIGKSAFSSFVRCKVIVGHGFKETIYTLNSCINYLLWKDILKPKVTADKGYGWTGV